MKIVIEGCAHGELETIYNSLVEIESRENVKIDLLICCGDFQSTRNLQDLRCMAVPPNYAKICTFYKYYSGEKIAPYLTIFIGGNHEASNYLQELSYGGWVAPNIYYLGYAGVINIAGIRIGGISGIYKAFDYPKGHYEISPYDETSKRSVYHVRNLEVFRLKQLTGNIDIFLSHDWPRGIWEHGNEKQLVKRKPFFKEDIELRKLGSPASEELLHELQPKYWFAAHMHCKFPALVYHQNETNTNEKVTKFLALDKCLPRRQFLQVVDIPHDSHNQMDIKYDLEWLTILFLTNHLLSVKNTTQYMPGPGSMGRWKFTPTQEEKNLILEKFSNDLTVPLNFHPTAKVYSPNDSKSNIKLPIGHINNQTKLLCEKLSIDDPTLLVLKARGMNIDCADFTPANNSTPSNSFNKFVPNSVERKHGKLNLSLPEPKIETSTQKVSKLNLTLPPPKNISEEFHISSSTTSETTTFIDSEFDETNTSIDTTNNTSINTTNNTSIFSDTEVTASTPQTKKFKRRNESIYKIEDNNL